MTDRASSLSFVIPVRNDAARLGRCLQTIVEGGAPGCRVEIIVADNGSTDESPAVARALGAKVLLLPGLRLGELRNRGAAAATGEILAFLDADHEIVPAWIPSAMQAFDQPEIGAVGAPYHAPSPGTWVQRLYDRLRDHPVGRQPVDWLGTGNMAVRRSVFQAVGGFDISLETCEDVDLCRKIRAAGHGLIADTRMRNIHHGDPRTLGQVFFGELWRGRDNIRVSLRPPWSLRTLVSAALPLANLIACTMMIVGLVAGSRSGRLIAAAALGYILMAIAVRASVMIRRAGIADWPKACAVAAAYESGRALAVTGRFGYRRRRRAALA
ncbi:MAG: glycosyltransferase [Vicinamibacterales bacterium]